MQKSSGYFKSFKSKLWGGSKTEEPAAATQPSDYISIVIRQKMNNSKAPVNICEGSGSWLESIEFGGKIYWRVMEETPTWTIPNQEDPNAEFYLESDSARRKDHIHIKEK